MCGITGFYNWGRPLSADSADEILRSMTGVIDYRGPDADGYYHDHDKHIHFGHRRLSIIDLTKAGAQPMQSANGRYVLTYNGELYNTENLRLDILKLGKSFKGHSDTEVLIEAIDSYGIEKTLSKLNGMYAFALYDRHEETLTIARDHVGIKPLYWGMQKGVFIFASTLKPILDNPLWDNQLNVDCLADYFSFNTIPAPQTILKDCFKLAPGHMLVIKRDSESVIKKHWEVPDADDNFNCDFEGLLKDAVSRQMVSDVPVGIFLSGGIDSSLLVALAQSVSKKPIKTYTIRFDEVEYDESPYAEAIADYLKTDHHTETFSVQGALDIIPTLPEFYDEPFADSSQLPSMLLCQSARQHATVCLSGDGGDELFAGYSRYFYGKRVFDAVSILKNVPLSRQILNLMGHLPCSPDNFQYKCKKLASMARQDSMSERYKTLIDLWVDTPAKDRGHFNFSPSDHQAVEYMRRADMQCYLPDDILHKMDRASMAHSLEVRVPYLDKTVVEAAFKLNNSEHYHGKTGKIILRDILERHIPNEMFDRPKKGFSVPIAEWLRHDLKPLMENAIANLEAGIMNVSMIEERWKQHQAGTHNWQHSLWGVLMLQLWRERYKI